MGATADGTKELIAVVDGHRESELSWKEILLSLKSRGLKHAPELAIGDGALGFWKALEKVFPGTRLQRCTVHKTANILNKVAKSVQPQMKRMLHDIWDAPTKKTAEKAFELFETTFEAKYEAAVQCLRKDRDRLLTFYDFPAENWYHIRTTNPIESTFATIRRRHRKKIPKDACVCDCRLYECGPSSYEFRISMLPGRRRMNRRTSSTVSVDNTRDSSSCVARRMTSTLTGVVSIRSRISFS